MYLGMQKLLTILVMPLSLFLIMIGGSLLLSLLNKSRAAYTSILISLLTTYLCSTPSFSHSLLSYLEKPYTPITAHYCKPNTNSQSLIILLGGGMRGIYSPDTEPRLLAAGDRVWHAARLYHAGCAQHILISGGGIQASHFEQTEAYAMQRLLLQLAVPETALILESKSRTTQENAQLSAAILKTHPFKQFYLVTSAWHMQRAQHEFTKVEIPTLAAAADFRSLGSCKQHYHFCWLPDAQALHHSSIALKEMLGLFVSQHL